ncbi:MAG: hypothetical protein ACU0C9_07055 [Paracoccaceae bacterium]
MAHRIATEPQVLDAVQAIIGAGPNSSDDRRIGVAIRYVRPDMVPRQGSRDVAILARGADRHGNFELTPPPTTDFAPRDLIRYDAIRTAQAKVIMAGARTYTGIYNS